MVESGIVKYLSPTFPIQNGLKHDASLLWSIPFKKPNRTRRYMKLNRIYQLLVYSDNVNLLGEKIITIKRKTDVSWLLSVATNNIYLGGNTEKTKCLSLSCQLDSGQNYNIQKVKKKKSLENVAKFEYLKITTRNQNLAHTESNSRFN